jgi:hypothetical protein
LGSIDFSTGLIKYKTLYPLMSDATKVQLGIFKSDTLYYANSNGKYLYNG